MTGDDEVLELRCDVCETWHPQDHEDAERLDIEAWSTHMMRLHPEHSYSQLMDEIMLADILSGGTDA